MLHLTFNEEAQFSHVVLAALIIVWFAFIGHSFLGVFLAVSFGALKEFIYDHYYEDAETRGSDWQDFVYYLVGTGLGIILVLLKGLF
jgi:hypothetical protein